MTLLVAKGANINAVNEVINALQLDNYTNYDSRVSYLQIVSLLMITVWVDSPDVGGQK